MPKILAFSDLHAHAFQPYSTILPNGRNSRLQDAVDCINQILQYSLQNDIDLVLFCGDLFHVRKHIVTQAFNAVYEAMAKFQVFSIPLVMIHGNHDQEDRDGVHHAVFPFRTFAEVVDEAGWIEAKGKSGHVYNIFAVPYIEDAEHLRDVIDVQESPGGSTTIFMGHLGVQGANAGADFIYRNPVEPSKEDLDLPDFDVGLLGHFHIHQELTESGFYYVGAPLQHNWGDKNQTRGFIVWDTDLKTPYTNLWPVPLQAPRFVEVEIGAVTGLDSGVTDDSFIRVVSTKTMSDDETENMREKMNARHVEVVKPKMPAEEAHEIRLKLDPSSSYEDMIKDYVNSDLVELDGLDEEYLISLGRGLVESVAE